MKKTKLNSDRNWPVKLLKVTGFIASIYLSSSPIAFASTQKDQCHIVEENNLWIPANQKTAGGITKIEFNKVLDRVEKIYSKKIQDLGKELKIDRRWDDGTVNAYANRSQLDEDVLEVHMFGGLARHETITSDAFALVACHEIGHHIGGAPKKVDPSAGSSWASNEGQADYWGTMKCMRYYLEGQNNARVMAKVKVDADAQKICNIQFRNTEDRAICARTAMAGKSLASLFKALRKSSEVLSFSTPDKNVVKVTFDAHPASQCRMDTYLAGSVCSRGKDEQVSDSDARAGVCNLGQADRYGARPKCWYAGK